MKALREREVYDALASSTRRKILDLVQMKALSIQDIRRTMRLHPATIRHHLNGLEKAGFIESFEKKADTGGRPKIYYRAVKEPPFICMIKHRYAKINNFLGAIIRHLLRLNQADNIIRKIGFDIGKRTANDIQLESGISEWTLEAFEKFFINEYLKEFDAAPEIVEKTDEKIVYRIHNCVFLGGLKMPEKICDIIHEGFNEGVSEATGKKMKITRLTCMGKGDTYCEYVCKLLPNKRCISK